uniref:UPF0586 protein C9orf41 homolog isoform X3 n=1 Tax=Rhizophora mucronata TaxID=61149 RepID=A0A2P2K6Y4_RHIMU
MFISRAWSDFVLICTEASQNNRRLVLVSPYSRFLSGIKHRKSHTMSSTNNQQ